MAKKNGITMSKKDKRSKAGREAAGARFTVTHIFLTGKKVTKTALTAAEARAFIQARRAIPEVTMEAMGLVQWGAVGARATHWAAQLEVVRVA